MRQETRITHLQINIVTITKIVVEGLRKAFHRPHGEPASKQLAKGNANNREILTGLRLTFKLVNPVNST